MRGRERLPWLWQWNRKAERAMSGSKASAIAEFIDTTGTAAPYDEGPDASQISGRGPRLYVLPPLPSPAVALQRGDDTAARQNADPSVQMGQKTTPEAANLNLPFFLPVSPKPVGRFIALARREGIVEDVRADEFDARLVDLMGNDDELVATFPTDDLSSEDAHLLTVGAVFYWIVGYNENASGQRSRVAEIKFRRLPARRKKDLANARVEAQSIRRELGL